MSQKNLQELLDGTANTVALPCDSRPGASIYRVVPSEFTNFRRAATAWRETAVLCDQSHHMHNIFISGPGALKLITDTVVNSTAARRLGGHRETQRRAEDSKGAGDDPGWPSVVDRAGGTALNERAAGRQPW